MPTFMGKPLDTEKLALDAARTMIAEADRLTKANEKLRDLVRDILDLVDDSRRSFHDSTVWEDEEYVGDHADGIAIRWRTVPKRAVAVLL
jgi:hypothetical protein